MPSPIRKSPAKVAAPKAPVEPKAALLRDWAKSSGLKANQLRGLASMFEQDFSGANLFNLPQGANYILKYALRDAADLLSSAPGKAPAAVTAATKEELLAGTAKALGITKPQLASLAKLLNDDFAGKNLLNLTQGASYSVKYALQDVSGS